MRIKRRTKLIALLVALAAVLYFSYHPLNWNRRIIGLTHSEVRQRLGVPVEDMFDLKGLEVYERRTITGRWLFLVGYDRSAFAVPRGLDSARVITVSKELRIGSSDRYHAIWFAMGSDGK
jgi:hypothetical protein